MLASLAAVVAIFLLIPQIRIGNEQLKEARQMRRADALRGLEALHSRQATLLLALTSEVQAIQGSMDIDERLFNPTSAPQDDRAKVRHVAWTTEGESGYHRAYVWTPLRFATIEQAINGAYDLLLTQEQLTDLQTLRLSVLRINAAAATKSAATSAYLEGQRPEPGLSMAYIRLADAKMDNLNLQIQEEFRYAREVCQRIAEWVVTKQSDNKKNYERLRAHLQGGKMLFPSE